MVSFSDGAEHVIRRLRHLCQRTSRHKSICELSIQQHANASDPWFIYLAYQSIHEPLQAPAEYAERYGETPGWGNWSQGQKTISMMLACLDDGIKNVTDALVSTAQVDSTLIVLSADNGGTGASSNYPLRGGKHSIYEGVPPL